jgi:hypothetical protein
MNATFLSRRLVHLPDFWAVLLLVGVATAMWAPRLSGPIDLRYDAGVYYILGTSLAEGKGYRILSEPGEIQANQYPPLLPAVVAMYQKVLGTSNPAVVGHWLRLTYFGLFMAFLVAAYGMARYFLTPGFAVWVGLIAGLNLDNYFLADLLFADVPYGLAACLFVILNRRGNSWRAFFPTAVVGVAAYLLRTAGTALLAAWVGESLLRKQWKQAALRAGVALVPILAWQGYVRYVESSPEYRHPTYAYQRTPYQYYNVSYATNIALIDTFSPETGPASTKGLIARFLHNAVLMPASLGEGIAGRQDCWSGVASWLLEKAGRSDDVAPERIGYLLVLALGCLILLGSGRLLFQGEVFIPLFLAASAALICFTPWPGQFTRYLGPLNPFLSVPLLLVLVRCRDWAQGYLSGDWKGLSLLPLVLSLGLILDVDLTTIQGSYSGRAENTEELFFYDATWREYDRALHWLKDRMQPGEIIATWAPHWAYLWTGHQAVMPPMEMNPATAQRLLDSVPATYLILDEFEFLKDLDNYKAGPKYSDLVPFAIPDQWEPIYCPESSATVIYKRTGRQAQSSSAPR